MRLRATRIVLAAAFVALSSISAAADRGEKLWSKGLAAMARGETESAIALFDEALELEPGSVRALTYRGLARRSAGDIDGAVRDLRRAAETADSTDPIVERAKLELAQTLALAESSDEEGPRAASRVGLFAAARLEYDSNAILAPDDSALHALYGVRGEADGRAVIEAGGSYAFVRSDRSDLVGAYSASQSLHFEDADSDVQRHQVALLAATERDRLALGASARYGFYLVDEESFASEIAAGPWLRFTETAGADLALSYELRHGFFYDDPFDDLSEGSLHSFAALQGFDIGEEGSRLVAGYKFELRDAAESTGEIFDFRAHVVAAGAAWVLPHGVTIDGAYIYRVADFDAASLGRDDSEHRFVASVAKQLSALFWLRLSQQSRLHDSDQPTFEYRRHVTSISLEARY